MVLARRLDLLSKRRYEMTVLQTIPEFGSLSGGTSTSTYDLLSTMNLMGYPIDLLTLQPSNPLDHLMGSGEEWIKVFTNDSLSPLNILRIFGSFCYVKIMIYIIRMGYGYIVITKHVQLLEKRKGLIL